MRHMRVLREYFYFETCSISNFGRHTVLPKAISVLKSAGFRLVTVAECLGQPAYKGTPGAPSTRDSSWRC